MKKNKKTVPVILGPTAVGKTEYALRIAEELGCELISCDSRQVYRGMDIGTAKPSAAERERVVHHLVDILDPSEPYSAFAFAADALRIIRDRGAAAKKNLICGGTGLYFQVLRDGYRGPDEADMTLREELTALAEEVGTEGLRERLMAADPVAAARIHPNDLQRTLRALDVAYRNGRSISSLQKEKDPPQDIDFRVVVLARPREELYDRINARVDDMIRGGLWDEFLALRRAGYGEASPGMVCVGYRELFAVERGETDIERAAELIKRNTRRYAKRQLTWFGNKVEGARTVIVRDDEKNAVDKFLQNICNFDLQ